MCKNGSVIHFIATWMPSELESNPSHSYTINMFPRSNLYASALQDIIDNYGWHKFTLIYQDRNSLGRIHQILKNHDPKKGIVMVRRVPSDAADYKLFLKKILKSKEARYIVDLDPQTIYNLVKEAENIDFVNGYSVN